MPKIPGDPTGHLDSTIQAANIRPREAARGILTIAARHDGMTEQVAPHLAQLLAEVDHWKDSWAHVTVEKDRVRREEARKALDCEHHGRIITETEAQVTRLDAERERIEKARLTLVGFLHAVDEFVRGCDANTALERPQPDTAAVLDGLRKASKRAHAAHQRAFNHRTT